MIEWCRVAWGWQMSCGEEAGRLCGVMLKSFTHSGEMVNLVIDDRHATSPMGESSKVALAGSITWAPGIADRMGLAVAGLVLTTSDF